MSMLMMRHATLIIFIFSNCISFCRNRKIYKVQQQVINRESTFRLKTYNMIIVLE